MLLIFLILPLLLSCQSQKPPFAGVKHPDWSYNKTVYELNVRQFSPSGTFKAVEQRLAALRDLGAGIIWLMPIHPIGEKNRKGTLGSPYSVKDYFSVNPQYGTMKDFKSLVDKIHEFGMYVILDWVANHTAWDNPLLKAHPDWFTRDAAGNFVAPVADWHDVVDLNYQNKALRRYMIKAMKYWVAEADVDGFRCDVAEMVPLDFWRQARAALDSLKPVFMLAEGEKPQLHKAFDMTYSWKMFYTFNDIAQGKKSARRLDKLLAEEKKYYPADAFRMRFTSNHDENAWNGTVFERLDGAVKTFAVLTVTLPGKPMIYNGQEAGMDKRLKFFERDPIEWRVNNYRRFYSRLLNLYEGDPALYAGEMHKIPTENDDQIYAFMRQNDDKRVLVFLNLSPAQQTITITSNYLNGEFIEYFTGRKRDFRGQATFNLPPWGYHVYVTK